jgi:ribonucleoside-diphosphate reductase alpha chain
VRTEFVVDYGVQRYRALTGTSDARPPALVEAASVAPEDQLAMQAALQAHVDNAISKTVSVPGDFPFGRFRTLFERAHALGLKGCTTFRPNAITGSVLVGATDVDSCCAVAEPPAGAGT